mmetsp:Transcript_45570/g.102903  ORF Transcript_45570/g.102903 Transcript_45570/m.102903 type:complete len:346 (-) Transcript_45570:142-1179(-)
MTKKQRKQPKAAAPRKAAKISEKAKAVKVKQPSARAARAMKKQAPKVVENTKQAIFLRGTKTSERVGGLLKDLASLRKPFGKLMQRKNPNMHPFEDDTSLEFLSQKNDCSLFAVANHSKKRPHNLTLGRCFDGHILDMAELGVEACDTLASLQLRVNAANPLAGAVDAKRLGAKPCVVFLGEAWDQPASDYKPLRSLLLDFVRGQEVAAINLASLDHVIAFTAANGKVMMRTYALKLRKPDPGAGSNVPRTRLVLSAPAADFRLRRTRWASSDLMKRALKQPRELKPTKKKNVSTTALGDTVGQIHMERQDYSKLQTRKVKALHAHKALPMAPEEEEEEGDEEST